ncbi:MAG TPA: UDP-glucose 4-epimerase, partial [Balneolaceae bacterium]|nr:UDP-glucose 4-epimerase [Balneolaceae bacterium]
MNVLVTGGAGYIGSHTVLELLNEDHQVVVVDNLSNSSEEALKRVTQITGKEPVFYNEDLLNKEAIDAIFEKHDIDSVIHFAGYKAVGESVQKPLMYYDNNITSTLYLCELMKKHEVKN